jgi:hypothetical protein
MCKHCEQGKAPKQYSFRVKSGAVIGTITHKETCECCKGHYENCKTCKQEAQEKAKA